MKQALIRLRNVSKYYINGNNVVAGLSRANLSLYRGEFVAITGESGSGKSTLGHILSGILPYEDGEMLFNGQPTSHFDNMDWEDYRKNHVSFISQSYGILPGATVLEHVVSVLRLSGMDAAMAGEQAMQILRQVELDDVSHRRAAKLSSGQKQRLSIARALAKPCDILVADEPTGNLDPENSEKVIRLLAQAAKDRLVIIITHEFPEVADYATRHVRLQDGSICADAQLRPQNEQNEDARRATGKRRKLSAYIAKLQLGSRPGWCAAVLLFFALTAFAVFVFLGSFIVALDDTPTKIFEPVAFRNGDMLRVAIMRQDGKQIQQEDIDAILGIDHVSHLDEYGYTVDMNYYYRHNIDYKYNYTNKNYGSPLEPQYLVDESVQLMGSDLFIQTVPVMADGSSIVTAGREPENFYEIVMVGMEDNIGRTIKVFLRDIQKWAIGEYLEFDMTVVGVADQGTGIYFHKDVARMMTVQYLHDFAVFPVHDPVYTPVIYVNYMEWKGENLPRSTFHTECQWTDETIARPIQDDEILISYTRFVWLVDENGTSSRYDSIYTQGGSNSNYGWMYAVGFHESTLKNAFGVSPYRFAQFMDNSKNNDQVSAYLEDYAYLDRVLEDLEEAGYLAISPYVLGSAKVDEALAEKRVQTLTISLAALFAVILLQMIVLRALFAMENEGYRILSNVGLPYHMAKNSMLLQVLLFTVLGQIVGLGAVLLCSQLGIQRIVNVTKYLPPVYWLLLCGVHLLISALSSTLIVGNLRKRVYPISSRKGDLTLDDEEVTV